MTSFNILEDTFIAQLYYIPDCYYKSYITRCYILQSPVCYKIQTFYGKHNNFNYI